MDHAAAGNAPDCRTCSLWSENYGKLLGIAAVLLSRSGSAPSLSVNGLVHEAYLKMNKGGTCFLSCRNHFVGTAVLAMKQALVDHGRKQRTRRRGRGLVRVPLAESHGASRQPIPDLVDLNLVLARLADRDKRAARVTRLKFFEDLHMKEIARIINYSKRTVEGEWTFAKAWLRAQWASDRS